MCVSNKRPLHPLQWGAADLDRNYGVLRETESETIQRVRLENPELLNWKFLPLEPRTGHWGSVPDLVYCQEICVISAFPVHSTSFKNLTLPI